MGIHEPSLDLQKAIRDRLTASADLLAMVPASNVLDVTGRPERMPSIIIGEGQTIYHRFSTSVHTAIHVWFQEPGFVQVKTAAGIIGDVLRVDAQMDGIMTLDHFIVHDMRVSDVRYLRDPHQIASHAVINVAAIVRERAS